MRILGVDYGEKRIGLSLSDPLGFTAQGLETYLFVSQKQTILHFQKICKEKDVNEVVIGLPVNMNGSMGPKAQEIMKLAPLLEKELGVPVKTWDERLTSREVGRLMIEEGLSRQKQRQKSDQLAAIIILQGYLESKR